MDQPAGTDQYEINNEELPGSILVPGVDRLRAERDTDGQDFQCLLTDNHVILVQLPILNVITNRDRIS